MMSILTMTPGPEWYEPADLIDEDQDDAPEWPCEALTFAGGLVWWSDAPILADLD